MGNSLRVGFAEDKADVVGLAIPGNGIVAAFYAVFRRAATIALFCAAAFWFLINWLFKS